MSDEKLVDREEFETLAARVAQLESLINDKPEAEEPVEDKEDQKSGKSPEEAFFESMTDASRRVFQDSSKLFNDIVDATTEAMERASESLNKAADEKDRQDMGDFPAAMVGMMRKAVDVQQQALDKFAERLRKHESKED